METQYSSEAEFSRFPISQYVSGTFSDPEWPNTITLINFKNRFISSSLSDYTIKVKAEVNFCANSIFFLAEYCAI